MHLLFVGDGHRDESAVPRIVERLLGVTVREEFRSWARLHRDRAGRGYGRKLQYAIRQAQVAGASGLVATLDADKHPAEDRLNELRDTRKRDRAAASVYPTALGEARPHLEAWLLDDAQAVREVLRLPDRVSVPNVRKTKNPKAALEELLSQSPRNERPLAVWADIAMNLTLGRCPHALETGLQDFAADVKAELEPLTRA